MTQSPELTELRKLAMGATQGRWTHGYWSGQCHKKHAHSGPDGADPCVYDPYIVEGGTGIAGPDGLDIIGSDYDGVTASSENLVYIAAASPSTILALLNALDEAREVLVNCASILPRYETAGQTLGDDEEHHAVLEQVEDVIRTLATIDAVGGKK